MTKVKEGGWQAQLLWGSVSCTWEGLDAGLVKRILNLIWAEIKSSWKKWLKEMSPDPILRKWNIKKNTWKQANRIFAYITHTMTSKETSLDGLAENSFVFHQKNQQRMQGWLLHYLFTFLVKCAAVHPMQRYVRVPHNHGAYRSLLITKAAAEGAQMIPITIHSLSHIFPSQSSLETPTTTLHISGTGVRNENAWHTKSGCRSRLRIPRHWLWQHSMHN